MKSQSSSIDYNNLDITVNEVFYDFELLNITPSGSYNIMDFSVNGKLISVAESQGLHYIVNNNEIYSDVTIEDLYTNGSNVEGSSLRSPFLLCIIDRIVHNIEACMNDANCSEKCNEVGQDGCAFAIAFVSIIDCLG